MKIRALLSSLTFGLLALSAFGTPASEPTRDLTWFLQRMRSVDRLQELEKSHTAMSSTWDRTGGNKDGEDFKDQRPGGPNEPVRNVLLDQDGPGCIHRIFLGVLGPQQAGTRIQIFVDHQQKPLFDMPISEFFNYENGPLPYPLVFFKSYPGTLFPIPFEKHCLVQLVNEQAGKPGWDPASWSNYWQVTYTRYPETTKVKSLSWPLNNEEKAELKKTCQAWLSAESSPPAEPAEWSAEQNELLQPKQSFSIIVPGKGVIRQMRVQIEPATPEVLNGIRMQFTWDGAEAPSVDAPAGFFFGHAFGGYGKKLQSPAAVLAKSGPIGPDNWDPVDYNSRFNSLLLGVTDSEAYSCFPMPFSSGAKLTFTNTGNTPVSVLRVKLDVQALDQIPANWGRFQATYTHSPAATAATPRVGLQKVPVKSVLDCMGTGKYVGVMLSIDWPSYAWWGEGDWIIWADQTSFPPDYHGTGSEEYFNSGWCRFDRKAVSGFVTLRPGHPTVYSFHLNDAFQFQNSIRVVEEQMGDKLIEEGHPEWTSTAFWYSLKPQPAGSD